MKYTRDQRRVAEAIERRSRGGNWQPWRVVELPNGTGGPGWNNEVRRAHSNGFYAVLERPAPGGVTHFAIRTPTNLEPPWRDLQRIKDELFGPERFAVQVCPPRSKLIDEADMYHLWIMPEGHVSPFGLKDEERP